jgi:hypothetical protein
MPCFLQLHQSVFPIAVAAVLTVSPQVRAADQTHSRSADALLGKFSTSDRYSEQNNISISISVRRENGSYQLGFQGMGRALHGHAPEGSGNGQIEGGVFRFRFQDSFSNRGFRTFRGVGDHYLLHIEISDVAEPRIMAAYDDTPLYRAKT